MNSKFSTESLAASEPLLEGVLFDEGLISGVDVSFTEENPYCCHCCFIWRWRSEIASVKNGGKRSKPAAKQRRGQSTAPTKATTISKIHQPIPLIDTARKERAREQSDIVE